MLTVQGWLCGKNAQHHRERCMLGAPAHTQTHVVGVHHPLKNRQYVDETNSYAHPCIRSIQQHEKCAGKNKVVTVGKYVTYLEGIFKVAVPPTHISRATVQAVPTCVASRRLALFKKGSATRAALPIPLREGLKLDQ